MKNKQDIPYKLDEWKIIESNFDTSFLSQSESIFSLSNGYVGIRGSFEENNPVYHRGTYINGFYETEPIVYGEKFHGYAENHQSMINVTAGKVIELFVDGYAFDLMTGIIHEYIRILDMQKGILIRNILWESPSGKKVRINIERLVSLTEKNLCAISYKIKSINKNCKIKINSKIDSCIYKKKKVHDPRVGSSLNDDNLKIFKKNIKNTFGYIHAITNNTKFSVLCSMENIINLKSKYVLKELKDESSVTLQIDSYLKVDDEIELIKYFTYHSSEKNEDISLLEDSEKILKKYKKISFNDILLLQEKFLNEFWSKSDIKIKGDLPVQQSIRFNLFQLIQSGRFIQNKSIPAKGLTGEGYNGHYFWDTEIYMLPFFIYNYPEIAKDVIYYRYSILDKARVRAKDMSQKGALFPWRTINGYETSAFFPGGTAQYHINSDIIYAMKKYIDITNDIDFIKNYGAEMLFETARLLVDLGDYIENKNNKFCINGVTGPDEYTALVNNNCYTNMMAKFHLEYAVRTARLLKKNYKNYFKKLSSKINLDEKEIGEWEKAAKMMFVPYDEKKGIHLQDDAFLDRARWDFHNEPKDKYPLLLNYHPLVIYRYQVLKQPDIVLASFLLGDKFSIADKKRNFNYYYPLTTGDSSLSPCIQSIISAELGNIEKAYKYFMITSRIDLDNSYDNVDDGLHLASIGGTWLSIVYGFAGMRDYNGVFTFKPKLPKKWKELDFNLYIRKNCINIKINNTEVAYTLLSGVKLNMIHENKKVALKKGIKKIFSLLPKLEAVIFDLDGVITDTSEYHYLAWKKLSDEEGFIFDKSINQHLKGIGRMESLEIILKYNNKKIDLEEKLKLCGCKNDYYKELIENINPGNILFGIPNLLNELKNSKIKLALASVSKNAKKIIKKLEIERYFDCIVDPVLIKKGKPDPEIFYYAADKLNVPYKNCIGIEDAQAGIDAIKEAGIFAVGVGNYLKKTDWLVSDTKELTYEKLKEKFGKHILK